MEVFLKSIPRDVSIAPPESSIGQHFSLIAGFYDDYRPKVPPEIAQLAIEAAGIVSSEICVVDIGTGTGLSTEIWIGKCARLIGVDQSSDMLEIAKAKHNISEFDFLLAPAHKTGIGSGEANIVSCIQSFHWMHSVMVLDEIDRLLVTNGCLIIADCILPPEVDTRLKEAYSQCIVQASRLGSTEQEHGRKPFGNHLGFIKTHRESWECYETIVQSRARCDASQFLGLLFSRGTIQMKLQAGVSEDELGIEKVRSILKQIWGSTEADITFKWRILICKKK